MSVPEGQQQTLETAFERARAFERICNLPVLIPFVLRQAGGIQSDASLGARPIRRTRLAKTVGAIVASYGSNEQRDMVVWFRHGPYPIHFQTALSYLKRNGIVEVDEKSDGYILTTAGLEWLSERVTEVEGSPWIESIANTLAKLSGSSVEELSKFISRRSPLFSWDVKTVGGKPFLLVWDWRKYGTGTLRGYHYSLMESFAAEVEEFARQAEVAKKIGTRPIINLVSKNRTLKTDSLLGESRQRNVAPLTSVFEKSTPTYLKYPKVEGKNYVHNRWYLVEAVYLIHVLTSLAPTMDELARVSLLNYRVALDDRADASQLRKLREGLIRYDVTTLVRHGILTRTTSKGIHYYEVPAEAFEDVVMTRVFRLPSPDMLKSIYLKRFLGKQLAGISDEEKESVGGNLDGKESQEEPSAPDGNVTRAI